MSQKTKNLIAEIARKELFIETLEERNSDRLDFHDVGVAGVKRALEAAYFAGQASLLTAAQALLTAKDCNIETKREWETLRRAIKDALSNARPRP